MKEHDKRFESEWGSAFEDAEMSPEAHVWDKIELGLTRNENSGFKKRILFFKLMAAASVLFAAVVGGYTVLNTSEKIEYQQVAQESSGGDNVEELFENNQVESQQEKGANTSSSESEKVELSHENTEGEKSKIEQNFEVKEGENYTVAKTESGVVFGSENDGKTMVENDEKSGASTTVFLSNVDHDNSPGKVEKLGVILSDMGALMEREMSYVPRLEYLYADNKSYDKMWVGVGLAYGQNNPSASSDQATAVAALDNAPGSEFQSQNAVISEEQIGSVMSAGVAVGKQVSKRWILESGLTFVKRSTLVESNLAVDNSGRLEALNNSAFASESDALVVTNTYEIENNYNSVSVPVQAGYLLVNRKVDVILKAGVANEILLWNRVEDTSGELGGATLKPGESSQYNTYLLSGVVGSEFSYLLGEQYFISFTPQLTKAINSVTKSELNSESRPLSFTLGFKVSYSF